MKPTINDSHRVAMVQAAWKDDPDSREGCGWDLTDRIRTMGEDEWRDTLACYLQCSRHELQKFLTHWTQLDDWASKVANAAMDDLTIPHVGVVFKGKDFWFEPKWIADSISLLDNGIVPIIQAADRECWEQKRKEDIRKLCDYLGCGHVAFTAADRGIDRVPKILELAASIR